MITSIDTNANVRHPNGANVNRNVALAESTNTSLVVVRQERHTRTVLRRGDQLEIEDEHSEQKEDAGDDRTALLNARDRQISTSTTGRHADNRRALMSTVVT
jgi:hypothetical protein